MNSEMTEYCFSEQGIKNLNKQLEIASNQEREYQDQKWGDLSQHPHTVGEWIIIAEDRIAKAKEAWMNKGEVRALEEMLTGYSVLKACFQEHGFVQRGKAHLGKKRMATRLTNKE